MRHPVSTLSRFEHGVEAAVKSRIVGFAVDPSAPEYAHPCTRAEAEWLRGGRGDTPTPIRFPARDWVRVFWRAWIDRKPYDPALHGGLNAMFKAAEG